MYNAIIEKKDSEATLKRVKGYTIGVMKLAAKKKENKKKGDK